MTRLSSLAVDSSSPPPGTVWHAVCGTILAAALLFATSIADADAAETPAIQEREPDVVVEATRPAIKRRIDAFVTGITRHTSPPDTSLLRWSKPVCPLVAGFPREQGEFVLERISQAAMFAGAPLAPRKCRANLYIVVTSEPKELLRAWRKSDRRLFGGTVQQTLDGRSKFDGPAPAAIDRFLNSTRPIHVWYNTTYSSFRQSWQATRLESSIVLDLSSVIVIVDANRVHGMKLEQVADYIAMVGLAKLDPDADVGDAPTILRLFAESDDAMSGRMSDWDRAFLKALYHAPERSSLQHSLISNRMLSDIAPQ